MLTSHVLPCRRSGLRKGSLPAKRIEERFPAGFLYNAGVFQFWGEDDEIVGAIPPWLPRFGRAQGPPPLRTFALPKT